MISKNSVRKHLIPLTLIALLSIATLLRFYRLNSGLWFDEILTYVKYARLPFLSNITTFDSENQHFLYSLLAHLSFLIFGESNWALRLPAAIFGIGSIAALFLLGREVSNDLEAFLATALLTFSYHHVWFSQNARGYTGLLFWTILSSWLFVRGLNNKHVKTWLFFAVVGALGVYTHLTMVFVLMGQLLIYLYIIFISQHEYHPIRWVGLWIGFCLGGLLVLLLFTPVFPQIIGTVGGSEKSVVSEWKNPLWTILEIAKGLEVNFRGAILAIGVLVLFGIGLLSYAQSKPVLLGLLIIPPLIGGVSVITIGHHLWPRFFFFAIGFGALVVVRGVMTIGDMITRLWLNLVKRKKATIPGNNKKIFGTILCVGMILVSAISVPIAYGPKQDYQGAIDFIRANTLPGDAVVTVSLASFVYQNFYHNDWIDATSLDALNQVRSQAKRTWLVYTFPPVLESVYPDIMTHIQTDFRMVKQIGSTVDQGTIYIYRSDSPTK